MSIIKANLVQPLQALSSSCLSLIPWVVLALFASEVDSPNDPAFWQLRDLEIARP